MPPTDHDALVSHLVSWLKEQKYRNIRAHLKGNERPGEVWWSTQPNDKYIPDATANHPDGTFCIFEAETADAIGSEHSEAQWRLFAAHAKNTNGIFVVWAESGSEDKAKKEVARLGIEGQVI